MSNEALRKSFDLFDLNHDGVLSSSELKGVMTMLGYHVNDEELNAIVADLDTNHDGVIDFEEFGRLYETYPPKPRDQPTVEDYMALFKCFDRDGNGTISTAELKATMETVKGPVTDEEVQTVMDEADTNNDGVINYEEFVRWIANH